MRYIAVVNVKDSLTIGNIYFALDKNDGVNMIKVVDDNGELKWYSMCLFQCGS